MRRARRALAFDRLFSDPATRLASGIHMMDLDALLLIVLSITVVAVIACLVRFAARHAWIRWSRCAPSSVRPQPDRATPPRGGHYG